MKLLVGAGLVPALGDHKGRPYRRTTVVRGKRK